MNMSITIEKYTGQRVDLGFVDCCRKDLIVPVPVPCEEEAFCPLLGKTVKVMISGEKVICQNTACVNWSMNDY